MDPRSSFSSCLVIERPMTTTNQEHETRDMNYSQEQNVSFEGSLSSTPRTARTGWPEHVWEYEMKTTRFMDCRPSPPSLSTNDHAIYSDS